MDKTPKYKLAVSEEQAQILVDALDLYSRVAGMGQLQPATEPWLSRCEPEQLEQARHHLLQAGCALTGMEPHASYGIRSDRVPDRYRVAYDMQQVIRHRLAWDRSPEGGFGVWFDEPHQTGQHELAKIERKV